MTCPPTRVALWHGFVAAVLATILCGPAASEEMLPPRPVSDLPSFIGYVPDEFVVVFRRDYAHKLKALQDIPGRGRANLPDVQVLLDAVQARAFDKQFDGSDPQPLGGRYPDMTGFYVVRLPKGADLDQALKVFSVHPGVVKVQKNAIHTLDLRPNDTRYIFTPLPQPQGWPDRQWQYMSEYGMDMEPAWDSETGDPDVIVAILDSGVKYRHVDLGGQDPPGPADDITQGNIWVNSGEIPGNGIDDDASGKIDDVVGWDFVTDGTNFAGITCLDADCGIVDNDPNDGNGHGTHLAGTVAGITNNARGIAGVVGGFSDGTLTGPGNGCKVMPLRIGVHVRYQGQTTGVVTMSWAAQAMYYVAKMKEKGFNIAAINCSWGSSTDTSLFNAVTNLVAHDVVIANSAGNSNTSVAPYLATLAGVTAVGATDSTGAGASFTNYGAWVDIGAPGVLIISTVHDPTDPDTTNHWLIPMSGTSMASPHVAGVAALLESYNSSLTAADKVDLMVNHTKPFGPGNTKAMGQGILDANLALAAAPAPTTGVGNPRVAVGPRIQLRAFPNPTRGQSDLAVRARPGQRVDLRIVDATGRTVRAMSGTADGYGVLRLRWDGRDSAGRAAGSGLFFATASTVEGRASSKLVVLD